MGMNNQLRNSLIVLVVLVVLFAIGAYFWKPSTPDQNKYLEENTKNRQLQPKPLTTTAYPSMEVDLDGDGTRESVHLEIQSNSYEAHAVLYVNKVRVEVPGFNPDKVTKIVDLDTSDRFKEVAVEDEGASSDYTTGFYAFDQGQIISMGTVPGPIDQMKFDGKGNFITPARSAVLETWFFQDHYKLDKDHSIVRVPQTLYIPAYETQVLTAQIKLPLQTSPTDATIITTLNPQDKAELVGCDNVHWCALKKVSDGKTGYFYLENYDYIPSVKLNASQGVFDGLSEAD